ncbi:hypothetical protein LCGC14_0609950 [marine sediment metagenome]|uniref:Uncharacterized protein n=1 Tax=marine sediment metagenome TaxID=412755 RepID=A0A0F9RCR0_9ZZZZ
MAWRQGCAEEWAEILASLRAEWYLERDVLKCDSMLVTDLIQATTHLDMGEVGHEWEYDRISNLYPDPSAWDAVQCCDWLDDHRINHPTNVPRLGDSPQVDEDAHAVVLREHVQNNAEPAEIMEWWAVTEWLAGELTAIGQPVLDNAYGYWWGRCTTGQAINMDGTLQEVARRHA